jgi:hypothetical protein
MDLLDLDKILRSRHGLILPEVAAEYSIETAVISY